MFNIKTRIFHSSSTIAKHTLQHMTIAKWKLWYNTNSNVQFRNQIPFLLVNKAWQLRLSMFYWCYAIRYLVNTLVKIMPNSPLSIKLNGIRGQITNYRFSVWFCLRLFHSIHLITNEFEVFCCDLFHFQNSIINFALFVIDEFLNSTSKINFILNKCLAWRNFFIFILQTVM